MIVSGREIIYAENCAIKEMGLSVNHEFIFKNTGEKNCVFAFRLLNANELPIPEDLYQDLLSRMKLMAERLKTHCEKLQESGAYA
jgi:hypothetical protein